MPDEPSDAVPISPLPPAMCAYAAVIIDQRFSRMLSHVDGVRLAEALEPVHQMRVWSRRSRAALDVFRDCFVGKDFDRIEQEVKTVTRALGAARDLDVMIDSLEKREAELPDMQRSGLESFIAHLKHQRAGRQKEVRHALARLERFDLARRFESMVRARTDLRAKPNKRGKRAAHGAK